MPSYLISSPGSHFDPDDRQNFKQNGKKVDVLDLILKIDNFEKRADVLLDGMKQLLDCERPFLDNDLSDYDIDVT